MSNRERELAVVNEIEKRYGSVIDLKKQPMVMIEIIRQFGHALDNGTGGGPPAPPPSSIAIAGPGEQVDLNDIMKVVINIQREVRQILTRLEHR
jgi:hypothetical protein